MSRREIVINRRLYSDSRLIKDFACSIQKNVDTEGSIYREEALRPEDPER